MAGRLEQAERLLAAADRAQEGRAGRQGRPAGAAVRLADDLPSVIAMLRANIARTHGDAEPATPFAKRAQAGWLSGRLAPVEPALAGVVAAYRAAGLARQAAAICYDLAMVRHGQGRLGTAIATCREALELAAAADSGLPPAGAAHVRLAEALRERDELDAALEHVTRGVALCRE
jgi:tetratricopeptide repeat protein